jgi:hypothetical protein
MLTGSGMKGMSIRDTWLAVMFLAVSVSAAAQTNLPGVTVTAPVYTKLHGGYLISGDFKVDPRMPYLVFPSQALIQDDILSIQPVHLNDDEYLVLQECATADCSQAKIVRVWNAVGATMQWQNSENRIWIRHENKYFIWMKRLPYVSPHAACGDCGSHFSSFDPVSPPLTIFPNGPLSAYYKTELDAAEKVDPLPVAAQEHEGSTFVVTYLGGSKVRIRRMHSTK